MEQGPRSRKCGQSSIRAVANSGCTWMRSWTWSTASSPRRLSMPKTAQAVKTYRFDQMAKMINDRVDDPAASGVERYVGLEHLDADSLDIRRWGDITDVESTKLRFKPGDIVFGKRRVYQRKL